MSGKWKNKKVVVLMGGVSKERDISLRTGKAIFEALKRRDYDVSAIDVGKGNELYDQLKKEKPEVALIALHGKFGEDGCIQGFLEMLRIPYTGGGVLASSVGMDKAVCTRLAKQLGLVCPEEMYFDATKNDPKKFADEMNIPYPVIVKPCREGSTINITIVKEKKDLLPALQMAVQSDTKILVEAYIKGKEITVGVLNGEALPALEIAPKSGFYDYESKYTKGMTEYIVPARIDDKVAALIQKWSVMIYNTIECNGTARADFIVTDSGKAYFLEINTIPGMTELSLVPKAAAHIGMSFDDVCEKLLDGAGLKVM